MHLSQSNNACHNLCGNRDNISQHKSSALPPHLKYFTNWDFFDIISATQGGALHAGSFLGEVIKRRRLELGLTQEQLCEGICEPITISRLENGKQTPSRNRINALLERLDMPADRYFALLSKNELEIESLQKQITAYNIRFAQSSGEDKTAIRKEALLAHEKLMSIADEDDMLSRQIIIRSKVILGKEDNPYSLSEQKDMLLEAIRVTCPSFDLDEISNGS